MKPLHLLLGASLILLPACKKEQDEIKVYKVSKEAGTPSNPHGGSGAAMPGGTMPGGDAADPHAGVPGMGTGADPHAGLSAEQLAAAGGAPPAQQATDSPPAHWKKQPPSAFLLVKYQTQGEGSASTDITFSSLRTAPGSLLANINRWRDQLGQAPIDEAAAKALPTVKTTFGDGVLVEIEGTAPGADPNKDGRLIGIIAEQGANAWYFKMRGNAALTAKEKDNFLAWAQSVKVSESPTPAPAPAPSAAPAPQAPASPASQALSWKLPDGWAASPNPGSRYATINIAGPNDTKAELAVTKFPGDVGGDLANVNRWRGQIGLPPVAENELAPMVAKITAGPKTIQLIDCTGPDVRLAAGWVRHGAETWFFKLTGPEALVGAEKAKFAAFLESVRFNLPE